MIAGACDGASVVDGAMVGACGGGVVVTGIDGTTAPVGRTAWRDTTRSADTAMATAASAAAFMSTP
jgi:hypothetical protein